MSNVYYLTRRGLPISVDTSDEACAKYGFKHGDQVLLTHNMGITFIVTIVGVASAEEDIYPEPEVLWFIDSDDDNKVSYLYPSESATWTLL